MESSNLIMLYFWKSVDFIATELNEFGLVPKSCFQIIGSRIQVNKGQIKPKAGLARRRFSQKTNKRVCSFFWRICSAQICFWFYLTLKCVLIWSIDGKKRAFKVQKHFNGQPVFYTVTKSCYTHKTLQNKFDKLRTRSDFKLRDKFQFA
jgi:hypothetical protein